MMLKKVIQLSTINNKSTSKLIKIVSQTATTTTTSTSTSTTPFSQPIINNVNSINFTSTTTHSPSTLSRNEDRSFNRSKDYSSKKFFKTDPKEFDTPIKRELKEILEEKDEKKKLKMVDGFINKIDSSILGSVKSISYLLSDLLKMGEIEKAIKIFTIVHSHQERLNQLIQNSKSSSSQTENEDSHFRKKDGVVSMAYEVMLEYYLNSGNLEGLSKFFKTYTQEYSSFVNGKSLVAFFEKLNKISFETFSELVYYLYSCEKIVSDKFSVNVMIFSLKVDQYSDNTFNNFYKFHLEKWGALNSRSISDMLSFLILSKRKNIIATILNDILKNHYQQQQIQASASSTNNTAPTTTTTTNCNIYNKYIQNMFKVFARTEKDQNKLEEYQNLLFSILALQEPQQIANLLFFYNTFFEVKEMKVEHRIHSLLLKRLNKQFLTSLPIDTQRYVIDQMILLFLRSDQYEKALFWFCSSVSNLGLPISKEAIISFIIYHQLQSSASDSQIRSKHASYYNFWKKLLNSTNDGSGGASTEEHITDFKFELFQRINAYKILDSVASLSATPRVYEMEVQVKSRDTKLSDYNFDLYLAFQLDNRDKFSATEILKFLEENYLVHGELPIGTLLIDTIISVQNDEAFSKFENRKPIFIEPLFNNKSTTTTTIINGGSSSSGGGSTVSNLILPLSEFISKYEEIKALLPILTRDKGDQVLTDNEISMLKNALFNLFYYRSDNVVQCIEAFGYMVERKIPIPFMLIEQACSVILENKSILDQNLPKMGLIYNYIAKFTHVNPTFEDGYLITLKHLIDCRKYQNALDLIESNGNFKFTQSTLYNQTLCFLELEKYHSISNIDSTTTPSTTTSSSTTTFTGWFDFFKIINSSGKFEDLSFIFNKIINHLLITSPNVLFKSFESKVLKSSEFKSQLKYISNETLTNILFYHRRNPQELIYYTNNCLKSNEHRTLDDLFRTFKELKNNDQFSKDNILKTLLNLRFINFKNSTSQLSLTLL